MSAFVLVVIVGVVALFLVASLQPVISPDQDDDFPVILRK